MPKRSAKKSAKKEEGPIKRQKRDPEDVEPSASSSSNPSCAAKQPESPTSFKRRATNFKIEMLAHHLHNPEFKDGGARAAELLKKQGDDQAGSILRALVSNGHLGIFMELDTVKSLTFGPSEEPFDQWVLQQVFELKHFGKCSSLVLACFAEESESVKALLKVAPSPKDWAELHGQADMKTLQQALNTIHKPSMVKEMVELLTAFDLTPPKRSGEGGEGFAAFLSMLLGMTNGASLEGNSNEEVATSIVHHALDGIVDEFQKLTPSARQKDTDDDLKKLDGFAPKWIRALLSDRGANLPNLRKLATLQVGDVTFLDRLAKMKFRLPEDTVLPDGLKWEIKCGEQHTAAEERVVGALLVAFLCGSNDLLEYLLTATTANRTSPYKLWDLSNQAPTVKTLGRVERLPKALRTGRMASLVAAVLQDSPDQVE